MWKRTGAFHSDPLDEREPLPNPGVLLRSCGVPDREPTGATGAPPPMVPTEERGPGPAPKRAELPLPLTPAPLEVTPLVEEEEVEAV